MLTPRIKATHVAFDSMKSHLDAIYDVTVVYEGNEKGSGKYSNTPSMTGKSLFLCIRVRAVHGTGKIQTLFSLFFFQLVSAFLWKKCGACYLALASN